MVDQKGCVGGKFSIFCNSLLSRGRTPDGLRKASVRIFYAVSQMEQCMTCSNPGPLLPHPLKGRLQWRSTLMARQERVSSGEYIPLSDMFVALRRANRALTHLYDLVLLPTGLKATQVAILQFIKQCGEVAQWRLAEAFCLSEASLSRRLTTLRAAGLVAQRIGNGCQKARLYPVDSPHLLIISLPHPGTSFPACLSRSDHLAWHDQ